MKDTVITVTAQERMEIEAILLDQDTEAAMVFLKRIKQRIEDQERQGMRSHLDCK